MKSSKEKKTGIGAGSVIAISIIYILLGLAMLFVPKIKEVYIVYVICAALIVVGILMIVRYFMNGSFKDIREFGFSGGVLAIVAGFCVMIRSASVAQAFGLFLGICILLTAVLKLQNAVDLNSMENRSWLIFLIIALAFIVAAVWIIIDPFNWNKNSFDYIYYILVADGAVGLFSTIYMTFAIRMYQKWVAQGKPERKSPNQEKVSEETSEPESSGIEEPVGNQEPLPIEEKGRKRLGRKSKEDEIPEVVIEDMDNDFPEEEDLLKAVFSESDDQEQ